MDVELIVIAIAPVVFLAWFMYARDRYEPEPRKLIVKTFIVGAFLVVPVVLAEVIGGIFLPPSSEPFILFLHFLIVVALVEESSKYVAVRVSVYGCRDFNEPLDGLVYGAIAGLGFAAPENLLYVLSRGAGIGIFRAVLSVPGHALWGSMIGYYLAVQKLKAVPSAGIKGLSLAVVLHAAFDFVLVATNPLAGIFLATVIIAAGWAIFFGFRRVALAMSPFRFREKAAVIPPLATKYCLNCGTLMLADDKFCRTCGIQQVTGENAT